jgi:hypothetical protein
VRHKAAAAVLSRTTAVNCTFARRGFTGAAVRTLSPPSSVRILFELPKAQMGVLGALAALDSSSLSCFAG